MTDPATPVANVAAEIFSVSGTMNFFSWLICDHPAVWKRIGNAESSIVQDKLNSVAIKNPIWVTGLARSGSTLLLEILAGAPGVVSQSYKDFPPVFTPYAWNKLLENMSTGEVKPTERAHQDGILVTPDSPEAMEEPLWMSFFPHAHNPLENNVVAAGSNPEFASFLRNHIRKLLVVRGGQRYLAKANYQITRMEFLLDEFADARFVIPVRDPVTHIASLAKTHDLFVRGQSANERARKHLRRVGHYEFGLDRTPINIGNDAATNDVLQLWENGDEVTGWARYWNQLYSYVADRLEANSALADAACVVDYTQLCNSPQAQLEGLFRHCRLEPGDEFIAAAASRISAPRYYKPSFSDDELAIIEHETSVTLARLKSLSL
jgi:hypothetical protein